MGLVRSIIQDPKYVNNVKGKLVLMGLSVVQMINILWLLPLHVLVHVTSKKCLKLTIVAKQRNVQLQINFALKGTLINVDARQVQYSHLN